MRADSYTHLLKHGFSGTPGAPVGIDEYERIRAIGGTEGAVVIGHESEDPHRANNECIFKLAQNRAWLNLAGYLSTASADPMMLRLRRQAGVRRFFALPRWGRQFWWIG